jgi:tetratricopeptide (TPR) repeat protein
MSDVPVADPETLREIPPDAATTAARVAQLREDIRSAPDEIAELLARGDLVDTLRIGGDLGAALEEGRRAADRAEMVGTAAQQHLARQRLASVHQWRGEFAESTPIFTELLNASTQFGPVIEAFTHQRAGTNDYDQGHYADAREHFARALAIRQRFELPAEEIAVSRQALEAATRREQDEERT